jgi:glycosyltransferase involved in cell wall biosynthesis
MPTITALLHTQNDGLRLGRCLEMLYACDGIVIIDHHSHDDTLRVAREYGARIVTGGEPQGLPMALAIATGWIFRLDPRESVSEALSASLYECRSGMTPMNADATFSVRLREETASGWRDNVTTQTRIVPANWNCWESGLPLHNASSQLLLGELLRFSFP